jgi:hypothetical protein
MDKGIRSFARNLFVEQNELRRKGQAFTGDKGNTTFRKHVMATLMEQFGCTLASAATHYNDALQLVKAATPELVSGLGRPEGKNNGGRKKKTETAAGIPIVALDPAETAALLLEGTPATMSDVTDCELLQLAVTPVVLEGTAA